MKARYFIPNGKGFLALLLLISIFTSCKKLVEVDPPVTSVTGASVYNYDATASAVLTGLYTQISGTLYNQVGFPTISLLAGLSADEFTLWSATTNTTRIAYYTNALSTTPEIGIDMWYRLYPFIFTCNSAIEGLSNSSSLTTAVKQQLLGEAKFMRAIFYFYLVNLYGDVPLALSTDHKVNALLARSPVAHVYQQIISDLKDAQNLLSASYLDATLITTTSARVRPTKWAATALLARAYLFAGNNWVNAEAEATAVINNSALYNLPFLNNAFLKNSTEAIWQLPPVSTSNNFTNTQEARLFILPSTGPNNNNPVYLSNNLLNSFEPGDNRKTSWVKSITVSSTTYYYPFKYKVNTTNAPVTEYQMILRLGEQYLIRAEARAQQNNLSGAAADLNALRSPTRANLPSIVPTTQSDMLAAVAHERQVELFSEWGNRWLDLKRTGNVDAVMTVVTPQKGGTWNTKQKLYPIPLTEILKDPNLTQNPGY